MRISPTSSNLIPIAYVASAVVAAEELGHNPTPILSRYGLNRKSLLDPGKHISHEQYYSIIKLIITDFDIPELGLIQLKNEKPADYGLVGVAAMCSENLGEALETLDCYQGITASPVQFSIERTSANLHLIVDNLFLAKDSDRSWQAKWEIDTAMSAIVMIVKHLLNGVNPFSKTNLSYAAPKYAGLYDDILQCQVNFKQPRNEICCSSEWLKTPLPTANKIVKSFSTRHCDAIINKLSSQAHLVEYIEGIILSTTSGIPSLQSVAESLNISDRTLQRRLTSQGTSYRKLVNLTRHRLALQLLEETDMSIKEISYLLHYTEPPNFSLAFKTLEGCSPQKYRGKRS